MERHLNDWVFLQASVPKLQTVDWIGQFLRWQLGFRFRRRRFGQAELDGVASISQDPPVSRSVSSPVQ
jgi:hypothetical protein